MRIAPAEGFTGAYFLTVADIGPIGSLL